MIDIKAALKELEQLKNEKAKAEVHLKQLEERKEALAKSMADLGVTTATIGNEIDRLEVRVIRKLDEASGRAKAEASPDTSTIVEDSISSEEPTDLSSPELIVENM